jgi:dTDP-glucose 4,6-dehydratase
MSKQRVLITGGAGFLGSHLCDHYIGHGWDVVTIDNCVTGRQENLSHLQDHEHFSFIQGDVTQPSEIDGHLDLILHMASLASPPYYKKLPIETLRVGSIGTERMLELAVKNNARFVMASTSEVYGDPTVSPQPESYWGHVNPIGPRSMYDESKRFAEAMVMAFKNTRDANGGIVRIFNTYGPRMRWDDGRVVTSFLCQIMRNEPMTIHGDGRQTRSFCFVSDLINGVVRMAACNHVGPVNLGNPHNEMTITELAERLSILFDKPFRRGPEMPRQDENDPMQRCPDITQAQQLLGWEPKVSFEEGMRATYAYLRSALNA